MHSEFIKYIREETRDTAQIMLVVWVIVTIFVSSMAFVVADNQKNISEDEQNRDTILRHTAFVLLWTTLMVFIVYGISR